MNRRDVLAALALAAAPAFPSAQAKRTFRVAICGGRAERKMWRGLFAAQGLHDGGNVSLELFDWDEDPARVREIVASGPDAVLLPGGGLIALFMKATTRIPIVFYSLGADPVTMGLVQSYRRPGGNVTGTTNHGIAVAEKGWEVLKEMRPRAKRIGAFFDTGYLKESWFPLVREAQFTAASHLGLERVEIVVPASGGSATAQRAVTDARVELLDIAWGDWPWAWDFNEFLIQAAIPALWELPWQVKKGGLLALIGSMDEARTEAARIVAAILRGADPATTPVYEVRRIDLTLNLRTARRMNLEIPKSVLLRADTLVE